MPADELLNDFPKFPALQDLQRLSSQLVNPFSTTLLAS